jgi:AcrR family transcriptional regulator
MIIERDGLAGLSMRKLGRELSVDPMAVYHHVPNKRTLLALVTARTIGTMETPDPDAEWDAWVRQWAIGYWEVATANRDLILAGMSDPDIGAGGLPSTRQLIAAIARSGLPKPLVEPSAFIVVDAVHGAALGVAAVSDRSEDQSNAKRVFEVGLDMILSGIAARARSES